MSGSLPIPGDAEARELLAGEYVLGTLDARQAAAVAGALARDPALEALVAAWVRRLAPLTRLAPPEAPPPGLWERIKAQLQIPMRAAVVASGQATPWPMMSVTPGWTRDRSAADALHVDPRSITRVLRASSAATAARLQATTAAIAGSSPVTVAMRSVG